MKRLTTFFFVAVVIPAVAQLVQVGPPGETREHYCARVERIQPNLVLSRATELKGRIIDGSGAPFKNSVVELRLYLAETKQTSIKKVTTDSDGNFDLATVDKGRYRLLASPTRVFEQADRLECGDSEKCNLEITLRAHPSDMPDSLCPVR